MDVMEIALLSAGGIIFILSFLIPSREGKGHAKAAPIAKEELKELVEREMEAVRGHVDDVVEEAVSYAMERTERSLERLSNEKIMAINEYSETVLSEIHRNHDEAMFLYDMLNSKHDNLKDTVSEVNRAVKEAERTVNSFQKLAPEVLDASKAVEIPKAVEVSKVSEMPKVLETPNASFVSLGEMTKSRQDMLRTAVEPPIGADDNVEADGSNSNEQILSLYRQGMDIVRIARELELGVGEVKLVIDLYNSQV